MTTLFDTTANHVGDSRDSSQGGGYVDYGSPMVVGGVAQSFYAEVITGGPLDFAAVLVEGQPASAPGYWFNTSTSGPLSGSFSPYIITPNTHLLVYTRDLTRAFVARVVVSDGPTTPAPSTTYCRYGTTLQSSVGGNIILTAGTISAILTAAFGAGGAVLATLMDAFIGRTLYTDALCSGPPPTMPVFTRDDWLYGEPGLPNPASLEKFWQGMLASAWPYFCQCVPAPGGGTAPVSYPAPALDAPVSVVAVPPSFNCDEGDTCTMLNEMLASINGLKGQVSNLNSMVTLIQRQSVPFGYVTGKRHSALSGNGQIAVSDILGLSVQCTTVPSSRYSSTGDPFTYWGLGWVAFGTEDGWSKSYRVSHNPELIIPDPAGELTLIGYSLGDGVVADLVEINREP